MLSPGDTVVTSFSGIIQKEAQQAPGRNVLDRFFIDLDGPSAQVLTLEGATSAGNNNLTRGEAKRQITAREVGQVFAVALEHAENGSSPNIYLGATSAYGINIVKAMPGDGVLQRIKRGQPGAQFMPGQFGPNTPGAAGAIWRIDGKTGTVSLFATLPTNSGPGIGDIAYSKPLKQFYVSDLDNGLIYQIDSTGRILGQFDHGVNGRPGNGQQPVADDTRTMQITSPRFNALRPETWGYTQVQRRVSGMTVYNDRLYYAVSANAEVWSVGLQPDGSFAGDVRFEMTAASTLKGKGPITSMQFDANGQLHLAQRGQQRASYHYGDFVKPDASAVVSYEKQAATAASPSTELRQLRSRIPVGITSYRSSGGLAFGYGYGVDGTLKLDACSSTLWVTGDGLRSSQTTESDAGNGTQLFDVHGLQGLSAATAGVSPQTPFYIDADGVFGDPGKAGHMGDAAVWQDCETTEATVVQTATSEGLPPEFKEPGPPPPDLPPEFIPPPQVFETNLALAKSAVSEQCTINGAGSLCRFDITITNTGDRAYRGSILLSDTVQGPPGSLVGFSAGPGWSCWRDAGMTYKCLGTNNVINARDSLSIRSVVWMPNTPNRCFVQNTAQIEWAPPGTRWNTDPTDDIAVANAYSAQPGCQQVPGPTNLNMTKSATADSCIRQSGEIVCRFAVTVSNVGPNLFSGDVQVYDEPTTAGSASFGPAPWACSANGIGFDCTYPSAILYPGQQLNLWSWTRTPVAEAEAQACQISNQAFLTLPVGGTPANEDPADDNAQALAVAPGGICVAAAAQQKVECPSGFKPDKNGCSPIKVEPLPIVTPPPVTVCPNGMRKVRVSRLLELRRAGWDLVRQASGQWCGLPGIEPPPPPPPVDTCPHTMERVPVSRVRALRNEGWEIIRVQGTNVWCGRPDANPYPCRHREYLESSWSRKETARSKGAPVRTVRWRGKRSWCIGPIPSPERPICRGGTLAKIGNVWICRCPTFQPYRQAKRRDARGREIIICLPVGPGKQCLAGERTVRSVVQVATLRARGYSIRKISQKTWCARPPAPVICRPGETSAKNLVQVEALRAKGYSIRKAGRKLWCGRPPVVVPCRPGERTVTNPVQVATLKARGFTVRKAGRGRWCARPPVVVPCRPGERTVTNPVQVATLKARGFTIRKAGRGRWCARPPVVVPCRPGERTVKNPVQVATLKARGFTVRKAGRGRWCARPPVVVPCRPGERTVKNAVQVATLKARGFTIRKAGRGRWCARPPARISCRANERLVRNRVQLVALRPRTISTRKVGKSAWCVRLRKACKVGQIYKGGRCQPIIRKCPKGTIGIYPKCRRIVKPPQIRCPKGTVGKWPKCRRVGKPPRPPKCPFGYKGRPPNCKKIIKPPQIKCPKGTVGKWPKCRRVGKPPRPPKCPFGYKGRPPNCKKIVKLPKIKCPKGTVGKWPKCKRVR
ncbi:MAG: hypothetical protein AAGD43_20345 [Pseudomonadota bacterium]